MKCKRCGEEIAENSVYCEFCGAKVSKKESASQYRESQNIPSATGSQSCTSKTKSGLLWGLIAVLLASNIATVVYFHNKKVAMEQAILQGLEDDYKQANSIFDLSVDNIVEDKDHNTGESNWVFQAFNNLQRIERCEASPLFYRLGKKSVYGSKKQCYRDELIKARNKIKHECQPQWDQGEDNAYLSIMKARLKVLEYMIVQTEGESLLDVKIGVPGAQNQP